MIFQKIIPVLLNMLPHLGIYFLQNLLFLLNHQSYFMVQNLTSEKAIDLKFKSYYNLDYGYMWLRTYLTDKVLMEQIS